jgi:hypothetical protein
MNQVKLRWVVEFKEKRARERAEEATASMSLGELLYWVLFGEGRVETVREMQS